MEHCFDPERLRPATFVCEPDPRNTGHVKVDRISGAVENFNLDDQHEAIAELTLNASVPADIAQQFETTRNLYLYAWFVYRFYNVAEQHSLACLELALRERLKTEIDAGKIPSGSKWPTLRPLLRYAVEQGLIRNEGFETWRNRGIINSRARVSWEKLREMTENNLEEISWDESQIEITEDDLDWDFAGMLVNVLPLKRNDYAHGSTVLHSQVLSTIRLVCESINQLYPRSEP
jgi:hypothetical protein